MIEIREQYKYFTHLPGKESVIPLCEVLVRAFPTKIVVGEVEIDLLVEGPVADFTHLLDMEKGRVEVFGKTGSGYYHLYLFAHEEEVLLKLHRGEGIDLLIDGKRVSLQKKEKLSLLKTTTVEKPACLEKISFGCAKKPLLEKGIDRRTKAFALAQMIPEQEGKELELEEIEPFLVDLFAPKKEDVFHQGIGRLDVPPFSLFTSLYQKMKSFLVEEQEGEILILPQGKKLPIAGRAKNIGCHFGTFDILWKKGRAIQLVIFPQQDGEILFTFPGRFKQFRVKEKPNTKGATFSAGEKIQLKKGAPLYLDKIIY